MILISDNDRVSRPACALHTGARSLRGTMVLLHPIRNPEERTVNLETLLAAFAAIFLALFTAFLGPIAERIVNANWERRRTIGDRIFNAATTAVALLQLAVYVYLMLRTDEPASTKHVALGVLVSVSSMALLTARVVRPLLQSVSAIVDIIAETRHGSGFAARNAPP
jgi:uncharacterized Tic20 family protein